MDVAEYALIPHADNTLIPIPLNSTTTTQSLENAYLTVSDIFATAWAAISSSGFQPGDTLAVFGAGPVGLLTAYSASLRGASNIYIVDRVPMRLRMAEREIPGALGVNFAEVDPVREILRHEPGGVVRSVDCVGMEAVDVHGRADQGVVLRNMVAVTATRGGIGVAGVYMAQERSAGAPLADRLSQSVEFPITEFFNKHLRMEGGVVDPKLVAPELVELIASGRARPEFIATAVIGIEDVTEYYKRFDRHEEVKVYIRFPQ